MFKQFTDISHHFFLHEDTCCIQTLKSITGSSQSHAREQSHVAPCQLQARCDAVAAQQPTGSITGPDGSHTNSDARLTFLHDNVCRNHVTLLTILEQRSDRKRQIYREITLESGVSGCYSDTPSFFNTMIHIFR